MALSDYAAEVLRLLEQGHTPHGEILLERDLPRRWAERDGFDIVLDRIDGDAGWPANFHFGFEMESLQEVRDLYQAFSQAGVWMETAVFNNSRGSRFFCRTPEGVMIEVNTREDKQESWQNLF